MDKKLPETTNLCVDIMNSKRQVTAKRGNLVTWYKFAFTVKVVRCNVMLNLCNKPFQLALHLFLFSQYRSCYNICVHEKTKCQVPLEPLLGKQNIQAKAVYTSQSSATRKPARATKEMLIRGGSAPRSNPLSFIYHFSQKRYPLRIPSIDKWYPFHIPCLEL